MTNHNDRHDSGPSKDISRDERATGSSTTSQRRVVSKRLQIKRIPSEIYDEWGF